MLQRIQSLFVLISLGLWVSIYFFPLASVYNLSSVYQFQISGIYSLIPEGTEFLSSLTPLFILFIAIAVIQVITLFLYKRRRLQMRFCVYAAMLMAGFLILIFYYVFLTRNGDENASVTWEIPIILPLCSAILNIIAYRFILKDERLVRSIDRIR